MVSFRSTDARTEGAQSAATTAPAMTGWTFTGILRVLWYARRTVGKTMLAVFVAAVLIAFLLPRRYSATAQIMPPDTKSGPSALLGSLMNNTAVSAIMGSDFGGNSTGAMFVGVLNSETVANRMVDRFGLMKLYGVSTRVAAREELASRSQFMEDRKTGIISVTVSDARPERARDMAKAYTEELDQVLVEISTSAARREREFLELRLAKVKEELSVAEKDLAKFSSTSGAMDVKEEAKVVMQSAATVQGSLIAAESELEGLKQIYTDNNVRVRALRARIAELRGQLEKIGSAGDAPKAGSLANKLPLLGVTYTDLFRRAKVLEVVFETLTQQYELAKVQEVKETPRVKILDVPTTPEKKSFPPRAAILATGLVAGLLLGMAGVLARATWASAPQSHPLKQLCAEIAASRTRQVQPEAARANVAGADD